MNWLRFKVLADGYRVQFLFILTPLFTLLSLVRAPVYYSDVRDVEGRYFLLAIWIWGCGYCMLWTVGVHATLPVLGGYETHVIAQREDLSFLVEMHNVRVLDVSSGSPERGVLHALQSFHVGGAGGRLSPPFRRRRMRQRS